MFSSSNNNNTSSTGKLSLQQLSEMVRNKVNGSSRNGSQSSLPVNNTNANINVNNNNSSSMSHQTKKAPTSSTLSLLTEDSGTSSSGRYSSLATNNGGGFSSLRSAILDSFRMHWAQAWTIMQAKVLNDVTMDDLSSIVNHIEQMISLLLEHQSSSANGQAINNNNHNNNNNGSFDSNNSKSNSSVVSAESGLVNESVPTTNTNTSNSNQSPLGTLLDFLFSEQILSKVFQWSEVCGEWRHAMHLEQLKLYELLISQASNSHQSSTDLATLFQRPFLRPMNQLLEALSSDSNNQNNVSMSSVLEVEKRLVLLLNTICVAIAQNQRLLQTLLVFQDPNSSSTSTKPQHQHYQQQFHHPLQSNDRDAILIEIDASLTNNSTNSNTTANLLNDNCDNQQNENETRFTFPVFVLLTRFVHRDGAIGQQSRDALLLCLGLCRADNRLSEYIVNETDFCPLLATGLSGLFSSLPRVVIGQSMSAEQFQFKDELVLRSREIDQFVKCLEFCNAVVQITHPLVQRQLLHYIYHGFLVSVIGPALHQDVANVSIEDLESIPTYSNTLDEIITTTAYLDMFIQSISEPRLVRTFLEFLCLEQFDGRAIINTLIARIGAKSKLSLITLMLFKTLLDLNCEDLQFELMFKYLLRGKHLAKISKDSNQSDSKTENLFKSESQSRSVSSYQQNWLAVSGQKLFTTSLSHYLASLCPHQTLNGHLDLGDPFADHSNWMNSSNSNCKCNANYYHNYLDYLNDARARIAHSLFATSHWRNSYAQLPTSNSDSECDLDFDEDISFCYDQTLEEMMAEASESTENQENYLAFNSGRRSSLGMNSQNQQQLQQNSHLSSQTQSSRQRSETINHTSNNNSFELQSFNNNNDHFTSNNIIDPPPPVIGLFLQTLLTEVDKFFDNDVITNLHLTALVVSLCHAPHRLVLSLFFDETLSRARGVPCLLHTLQKLSLDGQHFADSIPNFDSMFKAAKINLESVPIGELNCQLVTGNHLAKQQQQQQFMARAEKLESNLNKSIGALRSFFSRDKSKSNQSGRLSRRGSNASITSTASHMLEVVPGGVRFINQLAKPKEPTTTADVMDKQTELIYNCILFDEFLLELSAILLEQSVMCVDFPNVCSGTTATNVTTNSKATNNITTNTSSLGHRTTMIEATI